MSKDFFFPFFFFVKKFFFFFFFSESQNKEIKSTEDLCFNLEYEALQNLSKKVSDLDQSELFELSETTHNLIETFPSTARSFDLLKLAIDTHINSIKQV